MQRWKIIILLKHLDVAELDTLKVCEGDKQPVSLSCRACSCREHEWSWQQSQSSLTGILDFSQLFHMDSQAKV